MFLEQLRTLVAERGQDWDKVLIVDARFTQTGHLPRGLASYVRAAWDQVRDRLAEHGDDRSVLFLHDAGLVGRYATAGGQELLVGLQAAARSPAAAPHGLWLLCPGDSAAATPHLDGPTRATVVASPAWSRVARPDGCRGSSLDVTRFRSSPHHRTSPPSLPRH